MLINDVVLNSIKSPVRTVEGRAYVYAADGSTAYTLRHDDYLKEFTIERIGDSSKFFGYGIMHKANIKAIDINRVLAVSTANTLRLYYVDRSTAEATTLFPYPHIKVTEVNRNENTNELSITAYDSLYNAAEHTFEELQLIAPYTIQDVVIACSNLLGLNGVVSVNVADSSFSTSYADGANFEATATIRNVLDAAAEATQTIYYIDRNNRLTFRRLNIDGEADLVIDKANYITLDSKTNRKLATITHTTELGDNVTVSATFNGSTQYIRDNGFWTLREDIATLLDNALIAAGGLTINQFNCSWRGNGLLEIGDKLGLITKDNQTVYSYLLNDTITYDGGITEKTEWSYTDSEGTAANSNNLGEALYQTFARVDKANKQIDIVASENNANSQEIASLKINTDSITQTVTATKEELDNALTDFSNDIADMSTQIQQTKDSIDITINERLNSVDSVTTSTGYKFGKDGLIVSRTDSEMQTVIDDDGMKVYREDNEVLTADNTGVKAENLHATTYLIIGTNSRFEDYDGNRTGCFWIGS